MIKWEKYFESNETDFKKNTKLQDQQCIYYPLRIPQNNIDFNSALRPKKIYFMRLFKGFTVVHVLWVRCTEEILKKYSQEVKTTKKDSTDKSKNFGKRFGEAFNQHKKLLNTLT